MKCTKVSKISRDDKFFYREIFYSNFRGPFILRFGCTRDWEFGYAYPKPGAKFYFTRSRWFSLRSFGNHRKRIEILPKLSSLGYYLATNVLYCSLRTLSSDALFHLFTKNFPSPEDFFPGFVSQYFSILLCILPLTPTLLGIPGNDRFYRTQNSNF